MDNFNPNAETIAGNAVPDPGAQLEHVGRTGQPTLLHDAYSGRGGAGKAGYATNDLPPIYDYFKSRGLLDNPKNPIQPSQADDPTLAGWANDYYNLHLPGHLEGVYNRKLTAKDPKSLVKLGALIRSSHRTCRQ